MPKTLTAETRPVQVQRVDTYLLPEPLIMKFKKHERDEVEATGANQAKVHENISTARAAAERFCRRRGK